MQCLNILVQARVADEARRLGQRRVQRLQGLDALLPFRRCDHIEKCGQKSAALQGIDWFGHVVWVDGRRRRRWLVHGRGWRRRFARRGLCGLP